ncbi:MAG: radical SAM protein [Desulfobacteraceae bacterium]|nr:MAG: radical SAM protein [Desulfobacteraceae bacterium]
MKECTLYKGLNNGQVQCRLCFRQCIIHDKERGFCKSRINIGGTLYSLIYGVVSFVEPTPIEEKPFIRFKPGSRCLSIGTYGCNFRCLGCQNHEISWGTEELDAMAAMALETPEGNNYPQKLESMGIKYMEPMDVIQYAKNQFCDGIAFTYNEPTIWLEYVLDTSRLAKENSLYTVYVTNSWLTPMHMDLIGPHIDAMALDIKSLDDGYYAELCQVEHAVDKVLQTCAYAAQHHAIHVETRTCVVPNHNDDPQMLGEIADWILQNLGQNIVWHILRFFPKHKLALLPSTPMDLLETAVSIGKSRGLKYVNMVADKGCD